MHKRDITSNLAAGLTALDLDSIGIAGGSSAHDLASGAPFLERPQTGLAHQGKVLAAIQPHSDDLAIICGGTVAKLVKEGYTGYMIRATNDDMGDDAGHARHDR